MNLNGNTVTVPNSALNNSNVTISGGYALALTNDITPPKSVAEGWTLNGSTATYKNSSVTAGYSISNNQIIYTPNSGGEVLITVNGVKSTDGLAIDKTNKKVTVANSALNQSAVSITGSDWTLAVANDVNQPETTAASWSIVGMTATYIAASIKAGYQLVNNQIIYTPNIGGEKLITITGVKSLDGIAPNGNTIKISNASLNQTTVTINDGYTLELDHDVNLTKSTDAQWKLEGTTAKYKDKSTTAGYSIVNNQIIYTPDSGGKDLVIISGVKSTSELAIDTTNKKVTVANDSLNKSTVTISNGWTLDVANDVTPPEKTEEGWKLEGTNKAVYKTEQTSAGYKLLATNQIVYTAESGGETLATVTGVKSTDGLTINKATKKVTVSAAALNKKTVTISNGWKLGLTNDAKRSTSKAWGLSKTTATYKQTTTAGYTLANNAITHSEKSTKTLVTVKGLKSGLKVTNGKINGVSISGKVVTVKATALNNSNVTIIGDGYTLKLPTNVKPPEDKKAAWSLNGSTAIYESSHKTAGYTLADDKKSITYSAATPSTTLATVKGAAATQGLSLVSNGKITLKKSALKSKITVSGGDEFDFAADYKNATITGSEKADTITARGSKLSIVGGKSDDTFKILGSNNSVKGGKGADTFIFSSGKSNVVTDYAAEDKISITSGTVKASASGNDVILSAGKGKITVTGGKGKVISYSDKNGEHTYLAKSDVTITDETTIKLLKNYTGDDFNVAGYGNSIQTIDASAVVHEINITGNGNANQIIGSSQNDVIIGGKANDTLTGGSGADIFVWSKGDGDDVITDYAGEDKISITSAKVSKITISGNDVIFRVGTGNKITVKGAKDRLITYIDSSGKEKYSPKVRGSTFTKGTEVKLLPSYAKESFSVDDNIKTIDASSVARDLVITGNAKANLILGGFGHDTIIGGKNNDTLYGSDGDDVFVYNNGDGNDLIVDYGSGDKISLAAGSISSDSIKGDDYVFTVGANKITLKNAANKEITVINSKGTEKTYNKLSGNVAWFLEDDNNFSTDNELSDLVETKTYLPAAQIETSTDFVKEDTFITYTGKK